MRRGFPFEVQCLSCSLGITQHLIKGGIARLEEVRDADGNLEDLFIRVRGSHCGTRIC